MSWQQVARKDVRDARRARTVWLVTGAFLLVLVGPVLALPGTVASSAETFVSFAQAIVRVFVPLVSIALGYKAVIGERDSGSVALLLALPHTRRDVAVGKFVGRAAVLAVPLVVAMAAAGGAAALHLGGLPIARYLVLVLTSLAFGLAFLGLTLGLSLGSTSSRWITGGALGAYVLFAMIWDGLIRTLVFALFRFMDPTVLFDPPDWALFVKFLAPVEAYERLVAALFDVAVAGSYTGTDAPWFVAAWVAPFVLLAWMILPVALGYRRFARADL